MPALRACSIPPAACRVHEKFRVIALGVPVPPFPGNPLDPPLRSRFQGRHIDRVPTEVLAVALSRLRAPTDPAGQLAAGDNRQRAAANVKALLGFYETLWQLGTLQSELSGYESQVAAFQHMVSTSSLSHFWRRGRHGYLHVPAVVGTALCCGTLSDGLAHTLMPRRTYWC